MTQRGQVALRFAFALFVLSVLPPYVQASHSEAEDCRVCEATPDSPAKQKCVKKLLPWVKSRLFDHQENMNAKIIIQWEDYLGIKDSDYQRVVAMLPIIAKADEIRSAARAKGLPESAVSIQMAGYYESCGPEWKEWVEKSRKSSTYESLQESK
jgi:hypothetical protein